MLAQSGRPSSCHTNGAEDMAWAGSGRAGGAYSRRRTSASRPSASRSASRRSTGAVATVTGIAVCAASAAAVSAQACCTGRDSASSIRNTRWPAVPAASRGGSFGVVIARDHSTNVPTEPLVGLEVPAFPAENPPHATLEGDDHERITGTARMSGSMSEVRSNRVLRVRLPWFDPTLATPHDFTLRSNEFIDLNRRFRDHLTSPRFLRDVTRDAHTAIAALDRRRRIRGETAWTLQRSVRLAAAAAALSRTRNAVGPSAECLDEYFHALATGTRWHFTSRSACPVPDGDPRTLAADDSLGWIGKVFERWLLGSELPKRAADARRVIVVVDDEGQLPFAHLLLRPRTQNYLASRVEIEYGGSADPRLVSLFAARLPLPARATDPGDADAEICPRL